MEERDADREQSSPDCARDVVCYRRREKSAPNTAPGGAVGQGTRLYQVVGQGARLYHVVGQGACLYQVVEQVARL